MTKEEMITLFNSCRKSVSPGAMARFSAWVRGDDFSFSNRAVAASALDYILARHEWALSDPEWGEAMMLAILGR